MIGPGDKFPEFNLPTNGDEAVSLAELGACVIYAYPKDDTPGCTTEAIEFTQAINDFRKLGIEIVGISPDPVKKHDKFVDKHNLGIKLISDEEKTLLDAMGVWVEKSMYGKTYMGVERSTFLIDAEGKILETWRKVRVKNHVETVLSAARTHFSS